MRARRREREHVGNGRDSEKAAAPRGRQAGTNQPKGGAGGKNNQPRRKRKRNKANKGKGNQASKDNQGNSPDTAQGGGKGRAHPGAGFWGDASRLPEPTQDVRITDDPAAVARSLGAPPLPGHEQIAEHYFRVVYERAVQTAGALAAAGGLIDPEALVDEMSD